MNLHLRVIEGAKKRAFCGQANARMTPNKVDVTCQRCLKKLQNIPHFPNVGIVRGKYRQV